MKFIHVSDTHIGCEIPTEYKDIRRLDFLYSFEKVIDFAIKEKVDFIIHSGDLLDNYYRINTEITLKLIEILNKLKENNIPIFFIKGNHDVKGNRNHIINLLIKIGLLKEANIKNPYIINDVYIYGISEPSNITGEVLLEYYKKILSNVKFENNGYNIFMFHGSSDNLINNLNYIEYRLLPRNIIPNANYYAYGHFHEHKYIKDDNIIFALPGSTERTDMSDIEEKDKKGFYYINDNEMKFIELNIRPLYIIKKEINNEQDINTLKDLIITKPKDSIIKLVLNYKRNLRPLLNNLIDNLIGNGYLILDESFSNDIEYEIKQKFEDNLNINNLFFTGNKEELLKIFNLLNSLIEEYYSGRESDIERIREEFYKNILS